MRPKTPPLWASGRPPRFATCNWPRDRREDLKIQTVTTRDVVHTSRTRAVTNGPTYFVKPGATAVGNIREDGYEIYPVENEVSYMKIPVGVS